MKGKAKVCVTVNTDVELEVDYDLVHVGFVKVTDHVIKSIHGRAVENGGTDEEISKVLLEEFYEQLGEEVNCISTSDEVEKIG